MARQATLKNISKETGVSVSTISRVLNNYKDGFSVKPEVRKRILESVERNDYRPSPILRTMRAKRTMLVAFLHYLGPNRSFTGVIERSMLGVFKVLTEEGYQMFMNFLPEEAPDHYLPQCPVDGIIVPDVVDPGTLDKIERFKIPYVSLNGACGKAGVAVKVDEAQCSRLLFEHLFELGHRRIAYCHEEMTPKSMRHYSLGARHESYLALCAERGLEPIAGHDRPFVDDEEILRSAIRGRASALIAYSHHIGTRLLRTAHLLSIRIPEDLSIVAFNDEFPASECVPSLTCASIPSAKMGELSAGLLLRQMRDGESFGGREFLLEGSLAARESSAPPKKI